MLEFEETKHHFTVSFDTTFLKESHKRKIQRLWRKRKKVSLSNGYLGRKHVLIRLSQYLVDWEMDSLSFRTSSHSFPLRQKSSTDSLTSYDGKRRRDFECATLHLPPTFFSSQGIFVIPPVLLLYSNKTLERRNTPCSDLLRPTRLPSRSGVTRQIERDWGRGVRRCTRRLYSLWGSGRKKDPRVT